MDGNCENCTICSDDSFEKIVCDVFYMDGNISLVGVGVIFLYSVLATAIMLVQCVLIIACCCINYIGNMKRKYQVTTRDEELQLRDVNRKTDAEHDNNRNFVHEVQDNHQITTKVTSAAYDEVIIEKTNKYIEETKKDQDHKRTPSVVDQPSLPTAPPLPSPPLTSSIPAKTEVTDTTYDEVITEKKNSYIGGTKQDHKKTPSIGGQPSLPTAPPLPPPPLASSIPAKIQVINSTYDEVIIEKTNKYIEETKKDQDHKRTSSVVDQPSLPTAPPLPPPPLTSSISVKTKVTDATYDEVITEKKNSYIGGTKQDHKKIPSVVGQPSVPTAPRSLASSIPMKTGAVKATSTKEGPTMYAIIDKSKKRKNRSSTHIVSPPSTLGGHEDTVLNEAKIQEKKRRRNSAYEDVVRLSTEDAGDNTYDKLDHNVIGTTLTPQILPIVPNYTDDVPGALPQYEIVKL